MPFTFAYPVAILPLPRRRLFDFPALVCGSMSPDFVYFLQGRASNGFGHTVYGFFLLNLPLVLVFLVVYRLFLARLIRENLPRLFCSEPPKLRPFKNFHNIKSAIIFVYSALIGMATHVFWDDFTHVSGAYVMRHAFLREAIGGLPVFKWLQYGGSVLGLLLIACYARRRAKRFPCGSTGKNAKQKWRFWLMVMVLSLMGFSMGQMMFPLAWGNPVVLLIRWVNCVVMVLLCLGGLSRWAKKS